MSLGRLQEDVFGPVVFCRKKRWNLWSWAPGAYNTEDLQAAFAVYDSDAMMLLLGSLFRLGFGKT